MLLFFDTETNGLWRRDLNPNHEDQPRLVSLAFQVTDDNEKVIAQYSSRIEPKNQKYPEFKIPSDAAKIHGISTKEAQETGISLDYALGVFTFFSGKCHTLIAHNLAFDLQIVQREVDLLNFIWKRPDNLHCTMMTSKDEMKLDGKFDDYKFPKLQECFDYFFHSGTQKYHDALLDVQLCRELYFQLRRKAVLLKGPQEIPKELLKRIDGEKYKNLVKFLNNIDSTKINEWENNFCQSVIEKLDRFDEYILLSNKQYETLKKIYQKHG
jgi:DNA polymerase III epsilon subunit-like protein|tara:strand:- start:1662 stop:2465 length:804 start_codon:yes stop_codon:yes gene_type:complete